MLHVTCYVIDIAQYHFLNSKMAALYFVLCQNFKAFVSQLTFQNVGNKTKMVLVTLIAVKYKEFRVKY